MHSWAQSSGNLFGQAGSRKYLNAVERRSFVRAAQACPSEVRLFCLTLCLSGGRISEILALTPLAIDLDIGAINLVTLKRRKLGIVRQVPMPRYLMRELAVTFDIRTRQHDPNRADRRIWHWSRTTAWRRVKEVMARAEVSGLAAMPKGLRHAFGVSAFQSLVPPHLVQRWLGHASLRTTAIYGDVIGADERMFAERMWHPAWRRWGMTGGLGFGSRQFIDWLHQLGRRAISKLVKKLR